MTVLEIFFLLFFKLHLGTEGVIFVGPFRNLCGTIVKNHFEEITSRVAIWQHIAHPLISPVLFHQMRLVETIFHIFWATLQLIPIIYYYHNCSWVSSYLCVCIVYCIAHFNFIMLFSPRLFIGTVLHMIIIIIIIDHRSGSKLP